MRVSRRPRLRLASRGCCVGAGIIRYMGACTVPDKVMIVTELLKGDLRTVIEDPKISLFVRARIARDMANICC